MPPGWISSHVTWIMVLSKGPGCCALEQWSATNSYFITSCLLLPISGRCTLIYVCYFWDFCTPSLTWRVGIWQWNKKKFFHQHTGAIEREMSNTWHVIFLDAEQLPPLYKWMKKNKLARLAGSQRQPDEQEHVWQPPAVTTYTQRVMESDCQSCLSDRYSPVLGWGDGEGAIPGCNTQGLVFCAPSGTERKQGASVCWQEGFQILTDTQAASGVF